MTVGNLFKTTTRLEAPFDGSTTEDGKSSVSDFLTIQSLTNFGVMTGAISGSWLALRRLNPNLFDSIWVPYVFAAAFGLLSIVISKDAHKKDPKTLDIGKVFAAVFIAVINSLILASAVVGTKVVEPSG